MHTLQCVFYIFTSAVIGVIAISSIKMTIFNYRWSEFNLQGSGIEAETPWILILIDIVLCLLFIGVSFNTFKFIFGG